MLCTKQTKMEDHDYLLNERRSKRARRAVYMWCQWWDLWIWNRIPFSCSCRCSCCEDLQVKWRREERGETKKREMDGGWQSLSMKRLNWTLIKYFQPVLLTWNLFRLFSIFTQHTHFPFFKIKKVNK